MLSARIPAGPLANKWDQHRSHLKLVNPANKRRFEILVVGSGLAGASASASLAELGYNVRCYCYQDSPRRAHSIAAQGGINAAKNYRNDGDSIWRLFHDTVKGGDFRSREANVHRLAQVSVDIIDQCVAQGVPFAREYGGHLDNRSFGGAQVSRTFYARGQTGQQLLLGAYQALLRQIGAGAVRMFPRTEMLDVVVHDGRARGIVIRDLESGKIESHSGDAVVLATGGYGNVFYLSTNAKGCNVTAIWRAHRRGALFANPCFTQIHPTCIPVSGEYQSKLTLMSESLRNDGRIWVPKAGGDRRAPAEIPENERDYYLERKYPAFGNLVPRDIASRAAKRADRLIDRADETRLATLQVEALGIRTPDVERTPDALSGGNQQKVVAAKWLATQPRILLLDEPTKGVDVGAKFEIHRLIRREADAGMACLVVSSDLPEVLGLADRILVMRQGRIRGELPGADATEAAVMQLAAHDEGGVPA